MALQTTRKSNLVQHKLTHSKEKPHQCEICGRSFSLAKNMRRHARQHDTNATIFRCKVSNCVFKSLRSDKYIEHMKKYHPATTTTTTENLVKTDNLTPVTLDIKAEPNCTTTTVTTTTNTSLMTSSPFNTISPPNKTVSDAYDAAMLNEDDTDSQFDEDLILAAASATDEDITNFVSPLFS